MAGPFAREEFAGTPWGRWSSGNVSRVRAFWRVQTMDICQRGGGLGTRENGNRASVYSAGEMEPLGQADSQAPQSMHFSGSMV